MAKCKNRSLALCTSSFTYCETYDVMPNRSIRFIWLYQVLWHFVVGYNMQNKVIQNIFSSIIQENWYFFFKSTRTLWNVRKECSSTAASVGGGEAKFKAFHSFQLKEKNFDWWYLGVIFSVNKNISQQFWFLNRCFCWLVSFMVF